MLSFDLVQPQNFERYYREVQAALSGVFYSSSLIYEVLLFVLDKKPQLVVEEEISCIGPSKALKTFKQSNVLISVGEIGVQLWELPSFRQIKWFEIKPMYLCAAIFSDEKTVVVANESLDFWDIATEEIVRQTQIPCKNHTRMLALTDDDRILAGSNFGPEIFIWNAQSGELLRTLRSASSFPMIQFAQDNLTLRVVHEQSIVEMDTGNGEQRLAFLKKRVKLTGINEIPGSLLLTVDHRVQSRSSELVLWDTLTWKAKWTTKHKTEVLGLFDIGTSLVSGGFNDSLKIWDLETGSLLTGFERVAERSFARFELASDRRRLIAATNAGVIIIFNLQ